MRTEGRACAASGWSSRLVTWLTAFALLGGVPAAQAGGNEAGADPAAPSESETRFESPREVLRYFLEHMLEDRPDLVVQAGVLDLSELDPDRREERGRELAGRLYAILNRTEYIDVDALPRVGAQQSYWEYRRNPPGRFQPVTVGFDRGEDGGWRVSAETVEEIPRLWESVRDLPTISEYRDNLPLLQRLRLDVRGALPPVLLDRTFLLENWQWLGLALILLIAVIVDRVTRTLLGVVLRRLAGRTPVAPEEVLKFERPIGVLIGALAFQALLPVVGIAPDLRILLDVAAGALATLAGVWGAYRLVDVVCSFLTERARRTDNRFDDMLVPLLRRTLKLFVTIIGLVYLASLMSEDLWGVVAGLSIGSLAVGFAARDSIENLFGTFTVLLDKPFQLGDWIVTDGLEGTVEEVGFRSTRIRTFYDSVISVPNRHFISTSVDNLGRRRYRRVKTMLSLTYDTPPEKIEAFCEGVRAALREHPYTRKDYYHVYLNEFSAASLDVLLYCFLECPDWGTELREKQRLFLDVLRVAEELDVDFAFPTQTIHLAKPEDLEHPDRPQSDREGTRRGREKGTKVARETLEPFGGAKPPPVRFDEAYLREQLGD